MISGKKSMALMMAVLMTALVFISLPVSSSAYDSDYSFPGAYASYQYYTNLLGVTLTGDMRTDIVAIAKSQVGYREGNNQGGISGLTQGGGNYTVYHDYMNYTNGSGGGCGMFVSWCAGMAGIPNNIIHPCTSANPGYSSGYGFRFFGTNHISGASFIGFHDTVLKGGSYIPQPGDFVFFSSGYSKNNPEGLSYQHVGLVEKTELIYDTDGELTQMNVYTLEGNSSDSVRSRVNKFQKDSNGYVYSGTYIGGFGIPPYTTHTVSNPSFYDMGEYAGSSLSLNKASSGEAVRRLQHALSVYACFNSSLSAPSISGTFDSKTDTAVRAFQKACGLSVDGAVGADTWGALRENLVRLTKTVPGDFILQNGSVLLYKGRGGEVTLPDGCTSVSSYAFYNSAAITTLRVPFSYKTVCASAFYGSEAIERVYYYGNRENFNSISVGSGNTVFTDADLEFASYLISFKTAEQSFSEYYPANSIPTPPTDIPGYSDDQYLYYFNGWDAPVSAAVKDTVYTARYLAISKEPVTFSLQAPYMIDDRRLSYRLAVTFGGRSSSVSAFSVCLDYSGYSDIMTLDLSSIPAYLEATDLGGGLVLIKSIEGVELYENQILASLIFEINRPTETIGLHPTLSLGEEGYLLYGDPADHYAVPADFSTETAWIPGPDGLTIATVSGLLNLLADDNSGIYTIHDVTLLLNILATAQNDTR